MAEKITTKNKILQFLQDNRGRYVSGEEIANQIFVTRACVWKNIKTLQNEGYQIDAVTNKGYRLRTDDITVSAANISEMLKNKGLDMTVEYQSVVASTNEVLKQRAMDGHSEQVLIAGMQTEGKGRRGRSFYSPAKTGIYFSILLYPEEMMDRLTHLTAIAAVAVATTIDEVVFDGKDVAAIKWVNDIYIGDRKVAGILTEGYSSFEDCADNYVVIGIGINLYAPADDFPKDIRDTAGYVIRQAGEQACDSDIAERIIAGTIGKIIDYYADQDKKQECLDIYRAKSFLIGNYVKINSYRGNYTYAVARAISDDYHLVVEYDDKRVEELSSGEVSVVRY